MTSHREMCAAVLVLATLSLPGNDAMGWDMPQLFSAISPEIANDAEENPTLLRYRYLLLNEALFESLRFDSSQIGSALELSLFENYQPTLSLQKCVVGQLLGIWSAENLPTSEGGYRWHAVLQDQGGNALISAFGDRLDVIVYTPNSKYYEVRQVAGLVYVAEEHIVVYDTHCGVEASENPPIACPPLEASEMFNLLEDEETCEGCGTGGELHVLVVYNTAAKDAATATGDCAQAAAPIECRIIKAVEATNAAYANTYANSGVSLEVRLVGMLEVDYSGTNTLEGIKKDLGRLTNPGDGYLDEVHRLRDYLKADLVVLILKYCPPSEPPPCTEPDYSGFANQMSVNAPDYESNAFSIVKVEAINNGGSFTLAHELGHNLGCVHDRFQENCVTNCAQPSCLNRGAYPYSFGYHFEAHEQSYRTIMAYPLFSASIVPYFSNPDVAFQGTPTGEAGCDYACDSTCSACPSGCDCECESADNARTINQTRGTVARYRRACNTANTTLAASIHTLTSPATIGNGASAYSAMSNSGQRIVFTSAATNFASSTNLNDDVYLFNRESGSVRLVSHKVGTGYETTEGNGTSNEPTISGGGYWIAFASTADDLIANSSLTTKHIYGCDVQRLQLKRLSLTSGGTPANDECASPSLSFSGRYLAFESEATNLDSNFNITQNIERHIYWRDRDTDNDGIFDEAGAVSTTLISTNSNGQKANGLCYAPTVSGDGQYVALESDANNLVSNDNNLSRDIFVKRLSNNAVLRASRNPSIGEANGPSYSPSISFDGQRIAFASIATNLVPGGSNGKRHIYVYNTSNSTLTRVSVNSSGTEGDDDSDNPRISANGRYVIFESKATNFDAMSGGSPGIFVHDLVTSQTTRVSLNTDGAEADDECQRPSISDDGRYVGFDSIATNLLPSWNNVRHVYLRDRGGVESDLTGDGIVNAQDLILLIQNWGPCECCAADFNQDGEVEVDDMNIMIENWSE